MNPLCRRRLLGAVATWGLVAVLVGCEGPLSGPRSIVLTHERLEQLLARRFPYTRRWAGLAELTLQNPRLRLLPETNRLGAGLDFELAENLGGARLAGELDLDCGLRFDAQEGAIRMVEVHVLRLDVDALPPAQRALVAQYASPVAERLLEGAVLYRVPADQLARARELGLGVTALRVQPDGLLIELARVSAN